MWMKSNASKLITTADARYLQHQRHTQEKRMCGKCCSTPLCMGSVVLSECGSRMIRFDSTNTFQAPDAPGLLHSKPNFLIAMSLCTGFPQVYQTTSHGRPIILTLCLGHCSLLGIAMGVDEVGRSEWLTVVHTTWRQWSQTHWARTIFEPLSAMLGVGLFVFLDFFSVKLHEVLKFSSWRSCQGNRHWTKGKGLRVQAAQFPLDVGSSHTLNGIWDKENLPAKAPRNRVYLLVISTAFWTVSTGMFTLKRFNKA